MGIETISTLLAFFFAIVIVYVHFSLDKIREEDRRRGSLEPAARYTFGGILVGALTEKFGRKKKRRKKK